jgi:tetratricopeptide (TPR) repeat protein
MRVSTTSPLKILLIVGLLLVAGEAAYAQETTPEARARVHFQQGVEAVQRGELTRATEHFEAAQALSPNPVVLYNLGQTYSALGRPVEAEAALQRYLASEPRPTDPKRIKAVEDLIAFNERRIGSVLVELTPADATLEVDGSKVVLPPPRRIRLAAGRHVLVANKPDFKPAIANVDVSAGAEARTQLELEPLPAPGSEPTSAEPSAAGAAVARADVPAPAPPPPAATASQGKSTRHIVSLVTMGAGGAAIVASAVFAFEANRLNHASNRDGHCDDSGCDPEGYHLREAAKRNGNWATGLLVSGAVVGALGLTLFLLEPAAAPSRPNVALRRSNLALHVGATDIAINFRF